MGLDFPAFHERFADTHSNREARCTWGSDFSCTGIHWVARDLWIRMRSDACLGRKNLYAILIASGLVDVCYGMSDQTVL